MIHGVEIKRLAVHADERGWLTELIREDEPIFQHFGQAYCTQNYPGIIRAFHYHKLQDDNWAVVHGMIKVVMFDRRPDSPTNGELQEVFMGESNPILLKIPVEVLHGYKTIGVMPSLLVNFPTRVYNANQPDEYRVPHDDPSIGYNWDVKIT